MKPVGAFVQLFAEVLVARGVDARHDGYALHDGRHRRLAVHLPDSVLLQLRDGLLPLPLHVAQRVRRVDVGDLQREAVEFVVGDQHLGQYLDARGQRLPRFGLEVTRDARVVRTPYDGPGLRRRHAVVAALFDQFEVAVARVVDLYFGNFGAHPHGQGELPFERRFHAALQFAQGDMLRLSHQPSRIPAVNRAPNSRMLRAVSPRQTFSSSPWSMRTILRHVAVCAAR